MECDVKNDWCEVRKISDIDMYLFIEKGLRGAISDVAKRYSEENNKYVKNYDLTKSLKYVMYLDMNSLCGWPVGGYLPYGGFK